MNYEKQICDMNKTDPQRLKCINRFQVQCFVLKTQSLIKISRNCNVSLQKYGHQINYINNVSNKIAF